MAVTTLDVAQDACALVGIDPITSFSDGSKEANVLNALYERVVSAEISHYTWRFCVKQATLVKLLDADPDAPVQRWDSAFTIPADCLRVIGVFVNDIAIEYDRYNQYVFCDATEADTVVMEYVFREIEDNWPEYFRLLIIYRLAAALASSVMFKGDIADAWNKQGNFQSRVARNSDSQQQTNRYVPLTRIIANRQGR